MTTTCRFVSSFWQHGCDDAKAGRGPMRPHPDNQLLRALGWDALAQRLANEGYMNGYRFGITRRHQPTHDEGSLC